MLGQPGERAGLGQGAAPTWVWLWLQPPVPPGSLGVCVCGGGCLATESGETEATLMRKGAELGLGKGVGRGG